MKKLLLMLLMFAPLTMMAQKFGHVNAQEIIQAMPEFTKAKAEIEALQKQYEADLKGMQDELQKKAEAFEKEQATLPENIKQRRETELQEMYQKIQQTAQDNQQQFNKLQQEKLGPILAKVRTAIENVAKNGGYTYIMEKAAGQPLYINEALSKDVTAEVKVELNKIK